MSALDPIFTHAISCELDEACATDLSVVNAARVSLNTEHPELEPLVDRALIGYLMKNKHGSPFEHGYFRFKVEAPIFVFREHHRHRAGHSYNEMSGRYTELEPKFYLPDCARSQEGKPGHYIYVEHARNTVETQNMRRIVRSAYRTAWDSYLELLSWGVAKEQARIVLPVGIYSKMIWSCNPRSLMHFLGLRNHSTAMAEIRTVAVAAEGALWKHMPLTASAFADNGRVAP